MIKLKPCPFCGCKSVSYETNQGTKWGFAVCDQCRACGPEVRTSYNTSENAEWHIQANIEWNNRSHRTTAIIRSLRNFLRKFV